MYLGSIIDDFYVICFIQNRFVIRQVITLMMTFLLHQMIYRCSFLHRSDYLHLFSFFSLVNKLTDTFRLCLCIHRESAMSLLDFHAVGLRYVSTAAGIVVGR